MPGFVAFDRDRCEGVFEDTGGGLAVAELPFDDHHVEVRFEAKLADLPALHGGRSVGDETNAEARIAEGFESLDGVIEEAHAGAVFLPVTG